MNAYINYCYCSWAERCCWLICSIIEHILCCCCCIRQNWACLSSFFRLISSLKIPQLLSQLLLIVLILPNDNLFEHEFLQMSLNFFFSSPHFFVFLRFFVYYYSNVEMPLQVCQWFVEQLSHYLLIQVGLCHLLYLIQSFFV